jgi:hypothetical protein
VRIPAEERRWKQEQVDQRTEHPEGRRPGDEDGDTQAVPSPRYDDSCCRCGLALIPFSEAQAACSSCCQDTSCPPGCGGMGSRYLCQPGNIFHVFKAEKDYWGIDEYDVVNQGLVSHHLESIDGQVERFSVPFRFVWPSELDLMAELAGMRLRERGAGGNGSRSRAPAPSTCRSGRSRKRRRPDWPEFHFVMEESPRPDREGE